jgi:two-component system, NtrC family, sensor histidine kinase HydH
MWKHGVLSALIVAVIWLSSSLVTTTYLRWLEGSYEKSLQQNLASIDAADALREEVWRLYGGLDVDSRQAPSTVPAIGNESPIRADLERLEATATTPEQRTIVSQLRELVDASHAETPPSGPGFNGTGRRPSRNWAEQISTRADQISQIDHRLLQESAARRLQIGNRVFWGRLVAILVGPILGIVLGWWISRRLVRTVAQIRVTLTGPAVGPDGDLGTVRFSGTDDLAFIQLQIETVVERLRRTGRELQQARAGVLRSERLAAIGGLAAGVAHELRNPLTSVKLLLQHAASRPGDAVLPATKLRLILDEVGRMEGTIQGLLDFSRPPDLQCLPHDLRETLRRATNLVEGRARTQGVHVELDRDGCPVVVDGDPQQLQQVFVNLLINGIEAMPDGGLLCAHVDVIEAKSQVRVRIEDNGQGIPADILPRLFEPFATSKERGTGLGLAVSRRIIEEHRGAIEAANRPEGGATFEVILPCGTTPHGEAPSQPASLSACLDG